MTKELEEVINALVFEYKEAEKNEKEATTEHFEGYYEGKKDLCYEILRSIGKLNLIGEITK
jgi:hypothetical protein